MTLRRIRTRRPAHSQTRALARGTGHKSKRSCGSFLVLLHAASAREEFRSRQPSFPRTPYFAIPVNSVGQGDYACSGRSLRWGGSTSLADILARNLETPPYIAARFRSGIEPCPRSLAERRNPSSIRRFCKPMIIKDLVALTGVEPGFAAFSCFL